MKRSLNTMILFLVLFCASCGDTNLSESEFDPNFVHVVYFWLNNPDDEGDRKEFEEALRKFLDRSEFAKTNFVGTPPEASRDVVDDSFTYCLIVTFASAEDQEHYQDEPAHLEFIEEASGLWEKVVVYDAVE